MNSLTSATIVVKANTITPFYCTGKVFSCITATALLQMSFEGQRYFDINSNLVMSSDEPFTQLFFQNTTATDITIKFYAGSVAVVNQGYEPKRAPSGLFSGGPYVLNAGASQAFNGSQTDPHVRQWIFSNRGTVNITLYNFALTQALATIFPGQNFTIETSDGLAIKNETVTNGVTVDVCTIAYTT